MHKYKCYRRFNSTLVCKKLDFRLNSMFRDSLLVMSLIRYFRHYSRLLQAKYHYQQYLHINMILNLNNKNMKSKVLLFLLIVSNFYPLAIFCQTPNRVKECDNKNYCEIVFKETFSNINNTNGLSIMKFHYWINSCFSSIRITCQMKSSYEFIWKSFC